MLDDGKSTVDTALAVLAGLPRIGAVGWAFTTNGRGADRPLQQHKRKLDAAMLDELRKGHGPKRRSCCRGESMPCAELRSLQRSPLV
jgi:hypothetical protein